MNLKRTIIVASFCALTGCNTGLSLTPKLGNDTSKDQHNNKHDNGSGGSSVVPHPKPPAPIIKPDVRPPEPIKPPVVPTAVFLDGDLIPGKENHIKLLCTTTCGSNNVHLSWVVDSNKNGVFGDIIDAIPDRVVDGSTLSLKIGEYDSPVKLSAEANGVSVSSVYERMVASRIAYTGISNNKATEIDYNGTKYSNKIPKLLIQRNDGKIFKVDNFKFEKLDSDIPGLSSSSNSLINSTNFSYQFVNQIRNAGGQLVSTIPNSTVNNNNQFHIFDLDGKAVKDIRSSSFSSASKDVLSRYADSSKQVVLTADGVLVLVSLTNTLGSAGSINTSFTNVTLYDDPTNPIRKLAQSIGVTPKKYQNYSTDNAEIFAIKDDGKIAYFDESSSNKYKTWVTNKINEFNAIDGLKAADVAHSNNVLLVLLGDGKLKLYADSDDGTDPMADMTPAESSLLVNGTFKQIAPLQSGFIALASDGRLLTFGALHKWMDELDPETENHDFKSIYTSPSMESTIAVRNDGSIVPFGFSRGLAGNFKWTITTDEVELLNAPRKNAIISQTAYGPVMFNQDGTFDMIGTSLEGFSSTFIVDDRVLKFNPSFDLSAPIANVSMSSDFNILTLTDNKVAVVPGASLLTISPSADALFYKSKEYELDPSNFGFVKKIR